MSEKLEILNKVGDDLFVVINDTNYKSDRYDAIVLDGDEFQELLKSRVKEEIPFLDNSVLVKYLPEKFNNELILNEYKELSKFDHTLLSNHITDENLFLLDVIGHLNISICDLILDESENIITDNYSIFIREK